MAASEIALWLLKAVDGQAVRERFGRRGLQGQIRSLHKALADSQHEREELEGIADLLARVLNERDILQAEVVRLRLENAALRATTD